MPIKITVHYPDSIEDRQELERRAAEVQAHAILAFVQRLPCPKEQKIELIKNVQNHIKKQAAGN